MLCQYSFPIPSHCQWIPDSVKLHQLSRTVISCGSKDGTLFFSFESVKFCYAMINASCTNFMQLPRWHLWFLSKWFECVFKSKSSGFFRTCGHIIQQQYIEFRHYLTRQVSSRAWPSIFHAWGQTTGRQVNRSRRTYECVMSHIWMRRVSHVNESCFAHECVMSHKWMGQVAHMNKSCLTVETPYPSCYFSISIRYKNNHMVISVPYPNAKVAQRIRRLHKNT